MGRVVGHWKERLTSPTPPRTLHFLLASRPTNYVADSDCRNVCFPFSPPQLRVHGACVMWPDGSKYTGEGTGMEGKGNQIDLFHNSTGRWIERCMSVRHLEWSLVILASRMEGTAWERKKDFSVVAALGFLMTLGDCSLNRHLRCKSSFLV